MNLDVALINDEKYKPIQTEQIEPWFSTYNPYMSPSRINVYPHSSLDNTPSFCSLSPWKDHIIIAHHNIEPYALRAGFYNVADYLIWKIRNATKRGDFCTSCPNKSCA